MSKYKCPSCEAIATSEQWSEATRRAYGPEIYEIDGTEKTIAITSVRIAETTLEERTSKKLRRDNPWHTQNAPCK